MSFASNCMPSSDSRTDPSSVALAFFKSSVAATVGSEITANKVTAATRRSAACGSASVIHTKSGPATAANAMIPLVYRNRRTRALASFD